MRQSERDGRYCKYTEVMFEALTVSCAVSEDLLEELQTLRIQEGIGGAVKHEHDAVWDLGQSALPEEPSR